MTFRITNRNQYTTGADQYPYFTDFVNSVSYETNGDLFPELTEVEFEEIKTKLLERFENPMGDTSKISGFVKHDRTLTPDEICDVFEFETEQAYLDFVEEYTTNSTINLVYAQPFDGVRDYAEEEISGRRIIKSADPGFPPGTILPFGSWIIRKWCEARKGKLTLTHETIV